MGGTGERGKKKARGGLPSLGCQLNKAFAVIIYLSVLLSGALSLPSYLPEQE